MSDIYLQITETPTVVTLSAPVISGALSSTVTVANTVTVALDSNSLTALENVTVTVGAAVSISNFPASQAVTFSAVTISNFPATQPVSIASVTIGNTVTIAGTVTANVGNAQFDGDGNLLVCPQLGTSPSTQSISGTVTASALKLQTNDNEFNYLSGQVIQEFSYGNPVVAVQASLFSALPAGTNRIGVVTIGAGTVTIGAGTAQIGSVTASISGTVPISISSVTVGNSVTIGSLPAISGTVTANVGQILVRDDGTGAVTSGYLPVGNSSWSGQSGAVVVMGGADDGAVPAHLTSIFGLTFPIAGTVTANTFALQGTAVTTSNFTSTTASTVLAGYNATREVLTIFNEGAGNLHVCAGATCTTIAYQVRLSAGDYYEVPNHQTTITHSAVFATAGTARVTQVS